VFADEQQVDTIIADYICVRARRKGCVLGGYSITVLAASLLFDTYAIAAQILSLTTATY